jgi:hypothetical protein
MPELTIRQVVEALNNERDNGGFWLPNIQRPFVWGEDQICRLFDSIMRRYPISTMLIWRTNSEIRSRKFIAEWQASINLNHFLVMPNNNYKGLVLDGQQRLQSLYIGLRGSFDGSELYFDVLSGAASLPEDIRYKFKFLPKNQASFPWVKFKELALSNEYPNSIARRFRINNPLITDEEENLISNNSHLAQRVFAADPVIGYQLLDGIQNPNLYSEDDIVEIFIRANSGGTKLEKSDLLFSLLVANWEEADTKIDELLTAINQHGFGFDRDFILKTCLVLLNLGAKYNVSKFRQEDVRQSIQDQWGRISDSIKSVVDFVYGNTFIKCDKALLSYSALIPLIYVRHHYRGNWYAAVNIDSFLIRTLLVGAFSGQSDRIIDALVSKFRDLNGFNAEAGYEIIRGQGRTLTLTKDRFFNMGYGSKYIHLILNLWYIDFNHVPAYDNNLPQIDHIFPQAALIEINRDVRNQLANCMLLTMQENGAGGKGDKLPSVWFDPQTGGFNGNGCTDEYLARHLIPRDPALWNLDRFEDFISARKVLIGEKFSWLIDQPPPNVVNTDSAVE